MDLANELTKKNATWEEWYLALKKYARSKDGSASDAEAWREGYDAGRTPAQEWFDAWGE